MFDEHVVFEGQMSPQRSTKTRSASEFLLLHLFKRNPRTGAKNFDYVRNPDVPLLVPGAAARRAGSSSRLEGPTRYPMGSQD